MKISLFGDKFDSDPINSEVALCQLPELLKEYAHDVKDDAPLWAPADMQGGKTEGHVQTVEAFALDFDTGEPPWAVLAGWNYVAHTTHSHTPEHPKWRVIVELDEPVPAKEWAQRFKVKCAMHELPCDPKCCNANRSFYIPPAGAEWRTNFDGFAATMPPAGDIPVREYAVDDGDPLVSDGAAFWDAVERAMQTLPASVEGDGGDDRLFEAACVLRKCFRLTPEACFKALLIFNSRCDPPWPEDRLSYKIDQAAKDTQHVAGELIPQAIKRQLLSEAASVNPEAARELARAASPFELISAVDMIIELPDVDWLVPRLGVAPGRPTVLNAYAGTGKTFAAQEMALSVASGAPMFGSLQVRQGSVLHLDVDQGRRATIWRYQQLAKGRGLDLRHLPLDLAVFQGYLTSGGRLDVDAVQKLADACAGRALCVVDSLRGIAPGMDENSSEFGDVLQAMAAISDATERENGVGCTFLVIHHEGHGANNGGHRHGRGTSAIQDRAGAVWHLTRDEDTENVEWSQSKISEHGIEWCKPFWTSLRKANDGHVLLLSSQTERTTMNRNVEEAMSRLQQRLRAADRWLRRTELVQDIGLKMSDTTAALSTLRAANKIAYKLEGNSHMYHWNPNLTPLS